jgi:hypothetical protein
VPQYRQRNERERPDSNHDRHGEHSVIGALRDPPSPERQAGPCWEEFRSRDRRRRHLTMRVAQSLTEIGAEIGGTESFAQLGPAVLSI